MAQIKKKRKSGITTGNAGEYFVMAELLRRNFDAQLADRNTKGYDVLVGTPEETSLRKVQVKTTRGRSWYVRKADFKGERKNQVTIYVRLGPDGQKTVQKPARYFIAKNGGLRRKIRKRPNWPKNASISMKAVQKYEDNWESLRPKGAR